MSSEARSHILTTTLELIGELGIGGLSNRVVAKSAGVSLGTLTYHFSSQQELLGEALQTFVDDELARLSSIAAAFEGSTLSIAEALTSARDAIETRPSRQAQIAQLELYLNATRDDGLRDAANRCYAAYDRVAAAVLHAAGVPEAHRVAPLLGALIDGLELRRLAVADLRVDLAEALASLVAGLGASTVAD
ncbi:TetR family transcriptional regulator [Saccharopolyspora sp. HNM0983]|uniref:TetR family transcriptional regulator n=1 Tax=Saccharopolyspora montiporae TaxID=2781240 RepID=A0A929BD05_9PSEU|nr:TetR/AcrR family transcriptional regulator [Saccharopolyspora sp. HNM0983]MBE9376105.1 TetR family transcriptional regulator [Saccharopolyspora sp. HNM0983]